ncbi:mechanosensitive ion channel protein [Marivirga tractuosa]|uniref:MscS Mechanosensitive ion channel n=1 Tax=Marivirga tractuosa (strain ATCC 23168 / DSM 4126 / NBRC 15989 / NCIMB 1408 / VKM B-1430 / H-43) TaxID=643867 RepID=E4TMM9_MARTH|nr:mechanosensitive ion channel family protein [Marivirga tractuosa]ADR20327.1 MscS Mechanosensitive ion channel [Marivirga tractuosa DSM 4126]BDD15231.1 mechanosensitive ion channel protein [Marivirga tractuosa]
MTEEIINYFQEYWQLSPELQYKIFYTVVSVLALVLLKIIALKIVFKRFQQVKDRYFWKNSVNNTYYFLLLVFLFNIWVEQVESLATLVGLVGAGLVIALQAPVMNVAGWIFIVIRKPFDVGDRIEINGVAGDVIDIRFFQFTINEIGNWVAADQSTGRIIHIPNGEIFKASQANYDQGFSHVWDEISLRVTFDSDWKKAKELCEKIVNEHAEELSFSAKRKLLEASKKFMIFYSNLTPFVYTSVEDYGIKLTMRYLTLPKKRRVAQHEIWEDILETFQKYPDIHYAYPSQRIYFDSQTELGKHENPKK